MRTTVQQKHTDGTIATLLRTALANRHDGNTKAYHQTLNTLRLAIEANIPNPEPAPPEEPEEPGLYITSGAPYFLLFRTAGGDWVRYTLEFGDDDDHSHSAPPIRQDGAHNDNKQRNHNESHRTKRNQTTEAQIPHRQRLPAQSARRVRHVY
ncbi:hypothetical protein BIFCAT_00895 [Bifidobacterium catenulatum DSM 16992 = JCM 1194 = LMG 11043]|uniref:Uncharacterized protein n=1 Tax=Bifidobacterium catenulatum DSM 16992 = JCM 1194 = LMG 11043 TaxID=566552 RepID=B6XUT9_9BIFI|nr:hypothetical protein BIFCAT_00895 [Bifidobacterium catenulatum DSM 16992 = JCM 1194 = LMG 11043]